MLTLQILRKLQTNDDYSYLLLKDVKTFLSNRQYKVVKLKKQGYKNIEVASKLKVSPSTITKEIKIIRAKIKGYLMK